MNFFLFWTWLDCWNSLIFRIMSGCNWRFRYYSRIFSNLCKIIIINVIHLNILVISRSVVFLLEQEIYMRLFLFRRWFNGLNTGVSEMEILCWVIIPRLHLKLELLLVGYLVQEIEMSFLFLCWRLDWWYAWIWEVQVLACIRVLKFHLEIKFFLI